MRKIIILLLGLYSIGSFGQSDLEIELLNLGSSNGINYRSQSVEWGFKVTNVGITNANITPYKIYVSEDQTFDINDIEVKDGNVGNNSFIPISGLNAGSFVYISSLLSDKFDFPPLLDANKQYYIIFKVERDIDGGEINISNNTIVEPFYLTLENKLIIYDVDYNSPLANKTPLFLIHGWQPEDYNAQGKVEIWDNFIAYFNSDTELTQNFKPYYVQYFSNVVPVNDLGHELRIELDNMIDIHDRQIVIVAHSMGGLVSRSFAKRIRNNGPFTDIKGGERVNRLITLGTPHHGSPMANGEIRTELTNISNNAEVLTTAILNAIDNSYYNISTIATGVRPESDEYNRSDLRWDNFDNLYSYTFFPNEKNDWLNSTSMNGDITNYFDDKIIAYGGYFTNTFLTEDNDNNYYYPHYIIKNFIGKQNDGIVPLSSALFDGHTLFKERMFIDYYHDEIAKGNPDSDLDMNGLDDGLFGLIKVDLLGAQQNAKILSSWDETNYPNTSLSNSSNKVLTIQNSGDTDLTIDSFQLIGSENMNFNFSAPTVPFILQPNESENIILTFQPLTIGIKSVTFKVNNTSVNIPELNIQLTGEGVQNAVTDYNTNTETIYNFGDVYIYGGSNLATLNVSNSSSAPYTVASLNITGANADLFTIVQQPSLPKLFNPGDSYIIVLGFDPDTIGEKTAIIEASFQNNTILDTAILMGNGVNTVNNPNAPKLTNYEYWYNSDYASKQNISLTGTNSNESLNFLANSINTTIGLNVLHFRAKDSNGSWSSVSSDYVHIQNATNGTSNNQIVTYEYWFDDDYGNKTTDNTNASNLVTLNLDAQTTNINTGLHRFNIRFKDDKNQWSSILTEFVLINNNYGNNDSNKIVSYEYWFDEDYANKIVGNTTVDSGIVFDSDISTGVLSKGLHRLNVRFRDSKQAWSSIQTDFILKVNELNLGFNTISKYRYWFNQDFTNMTSIDISPLETIVLLDDIDMTSFTTDTYNYIHFQFKDIYGNWSSVLTEEIYICGTITQPNITVNGSVLSTDSATSYQWYLDGIIIDGEDNQFYEATTGGNYSVEITNINGCKATSEDFLFDTLSINQEEVNTVKVFPNPANSEVYIISKINSGSLEVYNSLGQLVVAYNNIPDKVDVSGFDGGVYFFTIVSKEKKQIIKFIKM